MAGPQIVAQKQPMHPGELFKREVLPALELSISEAARRLRVSRQTLHRMIAGTHAVTPEMALRLGRFCGSGPYLWLRMQQNYDLWNIAQDARVEGEIERIPKGAALGDLRGAATVGTAAGQELASETQSGDEIGRRYEEIANLTEKLGEHAGIERSLIEAQIDSAYSELRHLQTQEAEHFGRAFEASLELPLGEGRRTLREARTLLSALEQIVGSGADEPALAMAAPPAGAAARAR